MQINTLSTVLPNRDRFFRYSNSNQQTFQARKIVPQNCGLTLDSNLISKLENLFKQTASEAPKGLKLKVSPTNGTILGLSKNLGNNSLLEVVKNFKTDTTGRFMYVTFKEFVGDELKNAIGIDWKSKEFIRLYKDGTLMAVGGNIVKIPSGTQLYSNNVKNLSEYINKIFENSGTAQNSEVEVLKQSLVIREELPKKRAVLEKVDETAEMSDDEFESMIQHDIEFGEKFQKELKRKLSGQSSEDEFDEFLRKSFTPEPVIIREHKQKPTQPQETDLRLGDNVIKEANCIISENYKKPQEIQLEKTVPEQKNEIVKNEKDTKAQVITKPGENQKVEKRVWRIDNAPFGLLSKPTQDFIANINETFIKLMDLRSGRRGSSKKIVELKNNYEPIIYKGRTQKNVLFKYKNGETVSVLYTKSLPNQTRIVHTDKKGNEKHFLIIDGQKVVSNLYKNNPWLMPEKFRFMTTRELETSGIENLVMFVECELRKYYNYMFENLGDPALVRRRGRKAPADLTKELKEAEEAFSDGIQKINTFIASNPKKNPNKLLRDYFMVMSENFKKCAQGNIKDFKTGIDGFWAKRN